jgi:hypothetical protein
LRPAAAADRDAEAAVAAAVVAAAADRDAEAVEAADRAEAAVAEAEAV